MDKSKKPPATAGGGGTGATGAGAAAPGAPGGAGGGGPGKGPGGTAGGGGGKGPGGKGPPKGKPSDSDAPGASGKAEGEPGSAKDDASANGDKAKPDKADTEQPSQPKPGSAGATVRDGAQKVLNLAMKSEWAPVEAVLKGLEKAVAAGGDDSNQTPLAGVLDPVSSCGGWEGWF
uniref:Uncharacterized protein n=1 Tax=Anopheles merus TaxID=30066 RepID=A0A182UPB2_ANOME